MHASEPAVIDRHDTLTCRFTIQGSKNIPVDDLAAALSYLDNSLAIELILLKAEGKKNLRLHSYAPEGYYVSDIRRVGPKTKVHLVADHGNLELPNLEAPETKFQRTPRYDVSIGELISVRRGSFVIDLALGSAILFVGVPIALGAKRSTLQGRLIKWGELAAEMLSYYVGRVNERMANFLAARGHQVSTKLELFDGDDKIAEDDESLISEAKNLVERGISKSARTVQNKISQLRADGSQTLNSPDDPK